MRSRLVQFGKWAWRDFAALVRASPVEAWFGVGALATIAGVFPLLGWLTSGWLDVAGFLALSAVWTGVVVAAGIVASVAAQERYELPVVDDWCRDKIAMVQPTDGQIVFVERADAPAQFALWTVIHGQYEHCGTRARRLAGSKLYVVMPGPDDVGSEVAVGIGELSEHVRNVAAWA